MNPLQRDPVHEHEGAWFFWDETWSNRCGPHDTRLRAEEGMRIYAHEQLGCKPRPVLIGMNNPYGSNPRYALYPMPERATGWRIWQMLRLEVECTAAEYRDRFVRYNVLEGQDWNLGLARQAAPRLVDHWLGTQVLVLGKQTRDAMWLPAVEPLTWHVKQWGANVGKSGPGIAELPRLTTWAWAPHPSGRSRWYNDEKNRRALAGALARMYLGLDA